MLPSLDRPEVSGKSRGYALSAVGNAKESAKRFPAMRSKNFKKETRDRFMFFLFAVSAIQKG